MLDIGLKFYAVPSPPTPLTDLGVKVLDFRIFLCLMKLFHISQPSENIHISNIHTLEGLLPFLNYWLQGACHGVGLEVKI